MSSEPVKWYDLILQQMASEAYLERINFSNRDQIAAALRRGNNRGEPYPQLGLTRLSDAQVAEFLNKFQIVHQASDDPTISRVAPVYYAGTNILANTGLSATLINRRGTTEFTLSIRSTEFQPWAKGGDRERDGFGADASEIFGRGFAFAQLDALESYYGFLRHTINPATGQVYLPAGSTLNVTGYSLGGHLAAVFTELHADEIAHTYTFNGAGRGTWDQSQGDLRAMLAYYRAVLNNPSYAEVPSIDDTARYALYSAANRTVGPLDPLNIYKDPRYKWAADEIQRRFRTVGLASALLGLADPSRTGLTNGAEAKVTQIYGREFPDEQQLVSNSGVHGPATGVFIEAQPFLEGWPSFVGGKADFGNGHSIVLVADSLALMRALAQLDPNVPIDALNGIFSAASNRRAVGAIVGSASVEDDALENSLDALRRLFLAQDIKPTGFKEGPRGFGDLTARNGFYDNLVELASNASFLALQGRTQLVDVSGRLATDMRSAAETNVAYRYALTQLDPFAVVGSEASRLYDRFGKTLELYESVSAPEGLTQKYLEDRAAFFERKFYITGLNLDKYYQDPGKSDPNTFPNAPDARGIAYQRQSTNYEDRASGFIASTGGNPSSLQHFLFGGPGPDALEGNDQVDHLYGSAGADFLTGGKADDYLEGGTGFDTYCFRTGDGTDTVLDADGKSILLRDGKPVSIAIKQSDTQWSLGLTTFTANGSDLRITFGASPDTVTLKDFDFAKAQVAYYDGVRLISAPAVPTSFVQTYVGDTRPEKNDTFSGTVGNESFSTGDGDDIVDADGPASATSANGGDDLIDAGADRDTVAAGGGKDWVEGGPGGDILAGNAGDDTLYGDTSEGRSVRLDAAIGGADSASTTPGTGDLLSGDAGSDVLIGAATVDLLLGGSGQDVIVGGGGDDTIYGDGTLVTATLDWTLARSVTQGGSVFKVAIANATVAGNDAAGGVDIVYGGSGDDWVFGGYGDDYTEGGQGNDALFGEQGSDVLFGGDGNDVLVGDNLVSGGTASAGNDYLDGGAGKDLLQGDGGDDILVGGTGDDVLVGGPGKDTYIFSRGDGRDQIFDVSSGTEASVLVFGDGFDPSALVIKPGSMVLDFGDAGLVELASFDHRDPNAPAAFESLAFADGTTLGFQDVLDRGFTITGTESDDNGHDAAHSVLVGTAFRDHISGLGGNDILVGLQGDDIVDGGAGADQLQGGDGNDRLFGGDGDDALFGMAGDDYMDGGEGRDWLLGGPGSDTYAYGAGDILYDVDGQTTIAFGAGVSVSDVVLRRQPTAFQGLSVFSVALKSELKDFEQVAGALPGHSLGVTLASDDQLSSFLFADGTVLDHAALLRETWVDPAFIVGGADNDTLEGYAGSDLLRGDDGDDVLRGFSGDDSLDGGAGNDVLEGGAGSDSLSTGAGDDTLIGGIGPDRLTGGSGSDFYVYARGDGDDVIADEGDSNSSDVLRFADISSTEVALARAANGDLILAIDGDGSVTIAGYYDVAANRIERIEFADGMALDSSALDALIVPPISGTAGQDVLIGTPYNDTLLGMEGDDVLDGGTGDDCLAGGPGSDTYRLRPNGGNDTIVEDGADPSLVQLDASASFADLAIARSSDDLVLSLKNGNASLTLPAYYAGQANWAVRTEAGEQESIADLAAYLASIKPPATPAEVQARFLQDASQKYATYLATWGATGGVVVNEQAPSDAPTIRLGVASGETGAGYVSYLNFGHVLGGGSANVLDLRGSRNTIADAGAGDDLIDNDRAAFTYTLATQNDLSIGSLLYGGDGSDILFGSWSNDWLLGGNGDDYLAGSQGNDTYVVLSTDTGTKIVDEVNDYTWIGGHGDNQPGRYSADTLLFADIPYSSVTLSVGQFDSTSTSTSGHGGIFSTLDIRWDANAMVRLLLPDASNRYLSLFPGESYGVETIQFSDGRTLRQANILPWISPITIGVPGSDASISGTNGDDSLSVPYPYSLFQRTTLNGFAGNDYLGGGSQNDVLDGGEGNDYLNGDYGADVLFGGAGDDTLNGQYGDDILDGGPGDDQLYGFLGNDLYLFSPGFGRDVISDDRGAFNLFTDTVRFGQGISPGGIAVTRDDGSLYLKVLGTTDTIKLPGEIPDGFFTNIGVDRVEFYDGTVWSRQDLFTRITSLPATDLDDPVWGTEGADILRGFAGNDRVMANSGDDQLYGDEGDDAVYGGPGNDLVHGNDGNDDVEGGEGNDVLYGESGDDYLEGDTGYDIMLGGDGSDDLEEWDPQSNFIDAGAGDDYVYVEGAPNFIIGGTGADWMDIHAADSVVAFNRGDGHDTAYAAEGFTLSLGGGIATSDLTLEADGADLVLRTGGADSVRLTGPYDASAWPQLRLQVIGDDVRAYDLRAAIDDFNRQAQTQPGVVLSLGGVLSAFQIQSSFDQALGGDLAYAYAKGRLAESVSPQAVLPVIIDEAFGVATQAISNADVPPIIGPDDPSVLVGSNANEQIIGGSGDDWLVAGAGNDTLTGGPGDDLLFGGPGADTYVYSVGDGTDTVFDPNGTNSVVFGSGIDASAITLGIGSLFLRVAAGGMHFESFDPSNPYGPRDADRFVFADGSVLTYEALINRGFDLYGTSGADTITGTATVDRIHGGPGDDVLIGGRGSDTYFYERGDGADSIVETSDPAGLDALQFGADNEPASLSLERSGDDLLITFATPGDSITLKDWYGTVGPGIERVVFADGTAWDAAALQGHVTTNRAPVLARPSGDQRAVEDTAFDLMLPPDTFVDPDNGDALAYSASLSDGAALPAWLTFDNTRFSGVPANADVGRYDIRVTATDRAGAMASDQFTLTVDNVNDAPLAQDDTIATDEDTPAAITAAALLANDTDDDAGDSLGIASVAERSVAGGSVTYLAGDEPSGLPPRVVYDPGSVFQHLAQGMHADDTFSYTIADAAGAMNGGMVHVSLIGLNDAPVATDDMASTQEDFLRGANANLLANDRDVDDDTLLVVASPGTLAGRYGALTVAANGDYSYVLDNTSAAVQSLRNGELVLDNFHYVLSDGIDTATGTLAVSVLGTNDVPLLAHPMPDVSVISGQAFSFGLPAGTFSDVDAGDMLSFSVALGDGGALPVWLNFDPETQIFSGTAQAGSFDLKVRATDQAGAQASCEFKLHAGLTFFGGSRNDHFSGTNGDDYLYGGAGNDHLSAGAGDDILQGGSGNDALVNETGNGLLDGGSGNDTLSGGAGNELYAGGAGNDVLRLGGGFNVIAFNSGDGKDTVCAAGGHNVISLGGGGLDYAKLQFEKSDQDLVLKMSGGDQITFKDWYQGTDKQQILDLQVIADAMACFDRTSPDPLRNKSVEHFDFRALVQAFDTARATSAVTTWALSSALSQFHLGGSDTEAYGGDLAYWYGRKGNFAGISVAAAQQIIGAAGFGAEAQTLRPFVGLQEGFTKLS